MSCSKNSTQNSAKPPRMVSATQSTVRIVRGEPSALSPRRSFGHALDDQGRRLIGVVVTDAENAEASVAAERDRVAGPPVRDSHPDGGRVGGCAVRVVSLNRNTRSPFRGALGRRSLDTSL